MTLEVHLIRVILKHFTHMKSVLVDVFVCDSKQKRPSGKRKCMQAGGSVATEECGTWPFIMDTETGLFGVSTNLLSIIKLKKEKKKTTCRGSLKRTQLIKPK